MVMAVATLLRFAQQKGNDHKKHKRALKKHRKLVHELIVLCFLCLHLCFLCSFPLLLGKASAQAKPQVSVSPLRAKSGDPVYVMATGFTPNRTAMSHLVRPDGTEYNPLRFRTNDRGEFFHKIDTTMLDHGTFVLWVEDEASNVNSNRAEFTVDR
jgi:hypothetical protein